MLTKERSAIKDASFFPAISFQPKKLAKLIITIQKSISILYVMINSHTTGNKSHYRHEKPSIKWRLIMRKIGKLLRDEHHLSLLCWIENFLKASICNRHVNLIFKLLYWLTILMQDDLIPFCLIKSNVFPTVEGFLSGRLWNNYQQQFIFLTICNGYCPRNSWSVIEMLNYLGCYWRSFWMIIFLRVFFVSR